MGLSTSEILVIVIVILVLFGAKKIPELARSLGRASYEFKKAKEDIINEVKAAEDEAAADDNAVTTAKTVEEDVQK
ncbi:MAG: twin-arginine translocase TatA/TatE family subunit [Lentisphaeria bacterium]|nr:twin-arginine translocase TatA/TatE family subunit [Lentisphaeria bacterium]